MPAHQPRRELDDGFTLVELLVVIIIIGILATIAIPTFLNQRAKANESAMKADLRNVAVYAETFWGDNGTYVGFEADQAFTGYDETQGVTLDVVDESLTAYCIHAIHSAVTASWYFDSDSAGSQMTQDPC